MIKVKVSGTKNSKVSRFSFRLSLFGLHEDDYGSYRGVLHSRHEFDKLKKYCDRKQLHLRIDNEYGKRGNSYREIFFRENAPVFGNCYFCAYCGKLLPRKKVTVDHLYPVGLSYRDIDMQKKLKSLGIRGINDPKNLVAACKKCNQKKGKSTGEWIRKGRIGRHQWVWVLRWLLRLALAAAVIYLVFRLLVATGTIQSLSFAAM